METSDGQPTKVEVSGAGAYASSSGTAAGQDGIAVGHDVLGNVIKAVNVIAIIGGGEGLSEDILRSVGKQIKDTDTKDSQELLRLIQLPVERNLGKKTTADLLGYMQIVGNAFGTLVDKYDPVVENTTVFPFGDFLRDLISLVSASDLICNICFATYGEEQVAVQCQHLGGLFAHPIRYSTLQLPEVNKALQGDLTRFLPHQAPIFLYRRADAQIFSRREFAVGQFFQQANTQVICPLQFQDRSITAYRWQQKLDHVFFSSFASAIVADFLLYLHRLNTEQDTAQRFVTMLRRLQGNP